MKLITEYRVVDCASCSFQFALPNNFIERREDDHKLFYCPSCGKTMYWPPLSDKEILKRQLRDVQTCCVWYKESSKCKVVGTRIFKEKMKTVCVD